MPHAERSLAGLADDRERLGKDILERRAVADSLLEFVRLGPQRLVGQGSDRRLERVDFPDRLTIALEQPLVPAAEHAGEDVRDHVYLAALGKP